MAANYTTRARRSFWYAVFAAVHSGQRHPCLLIEPQVFPAGIEPAHPGLQSGTLPTELRGRVRTGELNPYPRRVLIRLGSARFALALTTEESRGSSRCRTYLQLIYSQAAHPAPLLPSSILFLAVCQGWYTTTVPAYRVGGSNPSSLG